MVNLKNMCYILLSKLLQKVDSSARSSLQSLLMKKLLVESFIQIGKKAKLSYYMSEDIILSNHILCLSVCLSVCYYQFHG